MKPLKWTKFADEFLDFNVAYWLGWVVGHGERWWWLLVVLAIWTPCFIALSIIEAVATKKSE